ncbi:MAG: M23 family metallopeptidase [Chlorobium limicola]|uniref:M23 family metallopeptidase n=1 Tax=Chlorobium limicola TaxID=1092 RepID=UPI0023F2F6FC|nr:M23 family metallopeptidase [Chlorobium limicola]NTV20080.1 M23 family metallopeptidase [Chlorobium limicola]
MKTPKPFLAAAAVQLKHYLSRAERSFWLPFSAASLVMIFSIFTILSSAPGTYIDELGFTGDSDYVVIEDASEIKKPAIDKKIVQPGESLYTILIANGLTPANVDAIARQLKGSFSIRGFRPGQNYEIEKNGDGLFQRFTYFQDRAVTIHIERESESGDLKVRRDAKEYETRVATIEGSVSKTLASELARRERSGLMRPTRKLFAGRLDFKRDIKPGSEFRLLFEEKWLDDECISTGKIIAAEISVNKKKYTAYRYTDAKGKTGYYDEQGNALEAPEKTAQFIQPCSYSRISSGYGYRVHPLRRTRHFHGGVDMAARTGTPVKAVAEGTVIFRGSKGGAGNMITLKHPGGYHSQYLHLSRYAPKAGNGRRVSQGEIIGYVGSTGSSTGPHLDFRMIHNGKPVNPLTALSASKPEPGLSRQEKNNLLAEISVLKTQLDNNRMLAAGPTKKQTPVL